MAKFIQGVVVGQRRWTERLLSLQIEAESIRFEAGQFTKLALPVEGNMLARAYSFVNAPQERPHEFYYNIVPDGALTQRLARLQAGEAVWVSPGAAGFLVLSEVPEARNLWLLATGTGIAPFLSILKSETAWRRYGRIVLVDAVRRAEDLAYRDCVEHLKREQAGRFTSVVFVSRELAPGGLTGRIPQALIDGRLEAAAGVELSAASSQVMLCGNPAMVTDAVHALAQRGMKKHRRRSPGHITVENYW